MLVQFGNNWIQKIPLTGKLDSIISKLDKHTCSHNNYTNKDHW